MPESVLGLPVHPLVVHGVVVLMPLAAILTIVIAVSPDRRARLGWLTWILTSAGLASTYVATQSGANLEEQLFPKVMPLSVADHKSWGGSTLWFAVALWLAVTALLLIDWDRRRRQGISSSVLPTVVAVVAILVAMAAAGQVLVTGWTGAQSRWSGAASPVEEQRHA